MGLSSIVTIALHAADPAVDRRAAHGHGARQLRADRHPAVRAGRPPAQPRRHRRAHLRRSPPRWSGHIRGGLAHVNVVASMIFAGMSGVAQADAAGLGVVEVNAMRKEGFDPAFAAAVQRGLRDHRPDHPAVGDHGRVRGAGAGVGRRPVPRRLPAGHPDGRRADGDDLLAGAAPAAWSRRRRSRCPIRAWAAPSCARCRRWPRRSCSRWACSRAWPRPPSSARSPSSTRRALGFLQRELTVQRRDRGARARRSSPAACWCSSSPARCPSAGSSPPRRRR